MGAHDQRARDAGFSLVEVLVALTLFTIVAVSSSVALVNSTKYAESMDNRVVAAGLATAQITFARTMAVPAPAGQPANPPLTSGTYTTVRNGATFTVVRTVTLTCAVNHKRLITVKVSWTGIGAPVYADTVRAC